MELTRRQIRITVLISEGYSSDEIAEVLRISRQTVDSHRKAILKNSGCRNWCHYMAQLGLSGQLELWQKMDVLTQLIRTNQKPVLP